jgi:hypothetical protein
MTRMIDKKLMKAWVKSVGGSSEAQAMIIESTGISPSMAEKLVQGSYSSEPQVLIRRAICDIAGLLEDSLFPVARTTRRSKAS